MYAEKLAVIFPGIGYTHDKPLLYYAKEMAREHGYKIIKITYKLPYKAHEVKGKEEMMHAVFDIALKQTIEQLSHVEFDRYEEVLFIGKSIGTTIAGYYAWKNELNTTQVVLTPVAETFKFLENVKAIVFHGTADAWCDTDLARKQCNELNLPLHEFQGANHSLETKETIKDIKNLKVIFKQIEVFLF